MPEYTHVPHLREIILFLALSGILIPLLQRYRFSQSLGFLTAGVLFGPFGLGLFTQEIPWLQYLTFPRVEEVRVLADLGVVFLLFTIGLELSTERLWALRRWVFGAGLLQVSFTAALIGGIAYGFGNSWEAALILGLVFSLSSTAMVTQLLVERKEMGSPLGRASLAILLLQDLAVVPLLVLLNILGTREDGSFLALLGLALFKTTLAMTGIVLLGRLLLRPLFHHVSATRQPDTFMAVTMLATLGTASLTSAAGLSMGLGAFLAGLLLAETEYRHEVQVTIEPFKGLFMGLFFMSVGMGVNLRALLAAPVLIPLSVLGMFLVKAPVIAFLCSRFGLSPGRSVEAALLLGQGGEFGFIALGMAMSYDLLAPDVGQFMLLVIAFSMIATPLFAKVGRILGQRIDARRASQTTLPGEEAPAELEGHIVLAGFGRVGQLLGQLFEQQNIPHLAFERDAKVVAEMRAQRLPVYYGDASRPDLWRRVALERAQAVVITMDQAAPALHAVSAIRREYPDIKIYARARDEKHALILKQAGATAVIPETLESGLQLASFVLSGLGIPEEACTLVIQQERERRILSFRNE